MTQRIIRAGWTWIIVSLATGCGSGSSGGGAGTAPPQDVAVSADGVFGQGLVLRNNGTDDLLVTGSGGYKFATQLMDGATYDVSVYTQPTDPAEHCTVTSGSGTATSGTPINVIVNCALIVSGTYIGVDYANSGDAASYGVTVLDDSGRYTSSSDENDTGVITTGIVDTGTYSVFGSGIRLDSMTEAVSTNGEAIVTTDLTAGDTAYLDFGAKKAQSAQSDADLNGKYALVTYDHSGTAASMLTISADGAGTYSGFESRNEAGAIASGTATTGFYTVAADGSLSLAPAGGGASLRGALSDDGQLQVLSQLTTGQAPSITVGIKLESGAYSNALAKGNYVIVTMENAADSAVWHEMAFDGAGNVFGGVTRNDAGVITDLNAQHTYLTEQGTYSVAADGTLTLSLDGASNLTGAISADGEYLILIDLNAGQMPSIGVGLRSFIAFNPWGY